MGLFDQFPYTNFHELNLDWLLRMIKELNNTVENFVALNTIKYADPIQWDITTQYETNTVVVDPNTGTAYISSKPVPAGVALTNTDYWSVIFTLDLISANQNITLHDDGNNPNATFTSSVGDWLLWNGVLYRVTQSIAISQSYIVGYNIERYTVELFIQDAVTALTTYVDNVAAMIGQLSDLNTTDKTSIVNAINSVLTDMGSLSDLDTTDKTSIVNAINELNSLISGGTGFIDISKRGCIGDGATDNTELLQSLIEEAETTGNTLYIPTGSFVSDTLFVSSNIRIVGNGEIKNNGFNYDSLTASAGAGDTTLEVADGSIYHVNNILRITNGLTNDMMVVTGITGNTLSVKRFRYFDTYPTSGNGLKNTYAAASTVIKCTLQMFISNSITSQSSEPDQSNDIITNVYIEGITFRGTISNFNSAYLSVYDVTIANGGVIAYIASGVTITKCNFYNRIAQHTMFVGRCDNWLVDNCHFADAIGVGTSAAWNDSASGPSNHWDERTSVTTDISTNFEIRNCIIENCYCGIFESAGKYGNIHDNKITGSQHYGIDIYQGDSGFGTALINVHNNTIRNCKNTDGYAEGRGIGVNGGDSVIVANNELYTNDIGLYINISTSLLIEGNQCIGNSKASMELHRAQTSDVIGNRFASGSGTSNNVLINNDTGINATLNFANNVYQGNNTAGNSAIHLVNGPMGINFIGETIRSIRMFKIEAEIDTSTASIIVLHCAQVVDSSNLFAATQTELDKVTLINCYTAYQNMIRNSDKINSKSTTDLSAITSGVKGQTQLDETANVLKVYDGNSWATV